MLLKCKKPSADSQAAFLWYDFHTFPSLSTYTKSGECTSLEINSPNENKMRQALLARRTKKQKQTPIAACLLSFFYY